MKIDITAVFLLKAAVVMAAVPGTRAELPTEDVDTNGTMSLMERQEKGHGRGKATCGIYAMADYHKFIDLVYDMDNDLRDEDYTIDGGQCNRVHCYDTSALWVCNDNKDPIKLKGKEIAIALSFVRNYCCLDGPRSDSSDNVISGQQFTPWGWNANAGYGNCNDPTNIRPHM
ncbi:hypothetical protein INS49_013435 [Diaporthe citri]|uniref:uncharacterized protein n=1 Tax=Diaporthe citri TaxID=83186 RepID=UPI001C816082|nr:uncharacterized protein INS49_013435 [Diaporthe citri]KAG6357558.1 hypothetical protein INS49_013435 [Diaporthe citri]